MEGLGCGAAMRSIRKTTVPTRYLHATRSCRDWGEKGMRDENVKDVVMAGIRM